MRELGEAWGPTPVLEWHANWSTIWGGRRKHNPKMFVEEEGVSGDAQG